MAQKLQNKEKLKTK